MPDLFVATDSDGVQHHNGFRRQWPLPVRQEEGWEPGAAVEIPQAREIVLNVNRISAAVRAAGGLNVFIPSCSVQCPTPGSSTFFQRFGTFVSLRKRGKL